MRVGYLFWALLVTLVAAVACWAYGLPLAATLVISIVLGEFVILAVAVEDALRCQRDQDGEPAERPRSFKSWDVAGSLKPLGETAAQAWLRAWLARAASGGL